MNASSVIALLGNPSPLTLAASGSQILVYSSTLDAKLYSPALKKVEAAIKILPVPKLKHATSMCKVISSLSPKLAARRSKQKPVHQESGMHVHIAGTVSPFHLRVTYPIHRIS
jgi:hypothetical protein